MKLPRTKYPLIRLHREDEFILALIQEDLKSRKFFGGLRKLSLDDCYYESSISRLVFACAGFDEVTDQLFDFYHRQVEKCCEEMEASNQSVAKQAMVVYAALIGQLDRETISN